MSFAVSRSLTSMVRKAASTTRNMSNLPSYKTLALTTPNEYVVHVELNRPDKRNAINRDMWRELGECFTALGDNPDCRVIVLSGAGEKSFTAGIDLQDMLLFGGELAQIDDIGRKANHIAKSIKAYQYSISSLENCPKPVIAAIQGDCIGAGTDIVSAADIRFCSKDAYFQVKEIDIGMAADVGTLQRLPKIIGSSSLVNELAYTGRKLPADEAKSCGLVSAVFDSKQKTLEKSLEVANEIAKKAPVAVQATKKNLIFSRDHSVADGLVHIGLLNMAMLQSEDFIAAVTAQAMKADPPVFSKL